MGSAGDWSGSNEYPTHTFSLFAKAQFRDSKKWSIPDQHAVLPTMLKVAMLSLI